MIIDFQVLGIGKHIPLYDICRLTRNKVHTNGVFMPYNCKNQTYMLKDIEFKFVHKTAINCADDLLDSRKNHYGRTAPDHEAGSSNEQFGID